MRPYLGILRDSFREAVASRVLWILFAVATLFLAAIAPFGIRDVQPTRLARNSVVKWNDLALKLAAQAPAADSAEKPPEGASPPAAPEGAAPERGTNPDAPPANPAPEPTAPAEAKAVVANPVADDRAAAAEALPETPPLRVWRQLSPELQKGLSELSREPGEGLPRQTADNLLRDLNELLNSPTLYATGVWPEASLSAEARLLRDRGMTDLSTEERARFNRLLLEAAFPQELPHNAATDTRVEYFGWTLSEGLPLSRTQLMPVLRMVINGIVNFMVGALGGFAAILVTASMITQTFEPGSIDLLLSKPVSRTLVFLTKFAGGCIFIGLNAAYFVAGMYLVAGWRFDLWIPRLFWCIPVFLFMFVVFYSVCSLAGVLSRNTIVAIVLTIVFWGFGWTVVLVKTVMESVALSPNRVVSLIPAGETWFGNTERGQLREWSGTAWEDVFQAAGDRRRPPVPALAPRMVGPVYSPDDQRLFAVQLPPPQGRRGFRLLAPAVNLQFATAENVWARQEGPAAPAGVRQLFLNEQNQLLAVATDGVFRLQVAEGQTLSRKTAKFVFAGPNPRLKLDEDSTAGFDRVTGQVVTYGQGVLSLLAPNAEGKYELLAERKFEGDSNPPEGLCLVARGKVLLALEDGRVLQLAGSDLKTEEEYTAFRYDDPRFTAVSSDGRWCAVLYHGGDVWLYDAEAGKPVRPRLTGRGDLSAVGFDAEDRLMLCDQGARVIFYDLGQGRETSRAAPAPGLLEYAYRYAVKPLYSIFRKPVELDNVSTWLLTEKDSLAMGGPDEGDLQQARTKLDAWGTIRHSAVFVVVVLGLTCLYISRRDF
jgi:ABC-type transport system involved in multi-copper enzyme maturation permease subunit